MLALASTLAGCGESTFSGPTNPTPPPLPPPEEVDPELPRVDQEFTWDTRIITLFPGTQGSAEEIRALSAQLAGWGSTTFHICAEVSSWEQTLWNDGPDAFSPLNQSNLDRFLDVTARIPGNQVLLDVVCTLKEDGTSFGAILEWTRIVGRILAEGDYKHVAVHLANEAWHPRSSLRGIGKLRQMRDALRSSGFRGLIGTDDNAGRPGDTKYNSDYRRLGFFPDFHPWRNPDPNRRAIREMVDRNGGFIVLSETTAYSSWFQGLCCTSDREQILLYMRRCESTPGCVWSYHSTDGLQWPQVPFEWIP